MTSSSAIQTKILEVTGTQLAKGDRQAQLVAMADAILALNEESQWPASSPK